MAARVVPLHGIIPPHMLRERADWLIAKARRKP